jgi:hypothetical protein
MYRWMRKFTVDRLGTSALTPILIGAVFVALVVLMLMRSSFEGTPPPELGKPAATSDKASK